MADFKIAYDIVRKNEGGYANNPKDRGGETYKGIARKIFPSWSGWIYVDAFKPRPGFPKSLEKSEALQAAVLSFYENEFWKKMSLDTIIPQDICNELFDTAVNMGVGTAGLFLQRALNVTNKQGALYGDLKLDGVIGPKTVSYVNIHPNKKGLLTILRSLQGARYVEICEHNPSQEIWMNGWLERV